MSGSYVRDAIAPNLLAGTTLNSAASSNGTAWEATFPMDVAFKLETGTVTGTSMTLSIDIVGADDSGFSTNKVTLGRFGLFSGNAAAQSNVTRVLKLADVRKRWIRAEIVVAGTSPVYTGATVTPVVVHERENAPTDRAIS